LNKNILKSPKSSHPSLRKLPVDIWMLGLVSMFMDTSSELVHSLLPVFMSTVLGANMVTIGLVEGIAEAAASVTKMFSGVFSDYFRKRKILLILGYGLAAITKPIFPLATSMGWVFTARFVDRIGKGIRGAPRDALVADIAPPNLRGAAYGLRQSLDSVGAFVGPLLAIVFMAWFAGNLKAVLWVATVPAILAVGSLVIGVREPVRPASHRENEPPITLAGVKKLRLRYWLIVLLGAIFTLARFSEAFLVLRAQSVGLAIGYVPIVMILMNVFYSVAAYPAGIAADRFSRRALLIIGLVLLILADLILADATSAWHVFGGATLWGLHLAFTQGLFSKLVADTAPSALRGTAFGIFHLVNGITLFMASVIAGFIWDLLGPPATFLTGGAFAVVALLGLLLFRPQSEAGA